MLKPSTPDFLDNVPETLRDRKNWIGWKRYTNPDGKIDKVPMQASGDTAQTNNPAHWSAFDTAREALEGFGPLDGLGFCFGGCEDIVAIDIDSCRFDDGTLTPWAQEIVDRFGTYTEVTPSGTGVRIIGFGRWSESAKVSEPEVEASAEGKAPEIRIFYQKGFITVTGQAMAYDTMRDITEALQWLIEKYFSATPITDRPKVAERAKGPTEAEMARIDNVSEDVRLRRCKAYLKTLPPSIEGSYGRGPLWNAAKVAVRGFALPTDKAIEALDQYNQEKCFPPWPYDGPQGLERVIEQARTNSDMSWGAKLKDDFDGVAYPAGVDGVATGGKRPAKLADPAEEAQLMLEAHQHEGVNRLIFWSGGFLYWTKGKFSHIPTSEAKGLLVGALNERYTMVRTSIISDVMEQVRAASMVSVQFQPPSWLTPNEWKPRDVIATENSIVHLPSFVEGKPGSSIPSTPAFFTTSALDYEFDLEKPDCPQWKAFLRQLWPEDQESIDTLQEWFGYCLTPDTRLQKMLFLLGPKRSGKGTICRVLRSVVGDTNVCGPTLASLQGQFGLWPLLGKTLAIISDARLSGRSDQATIVERLLSISGEDAQTIDRKNMEPVTTKLSTRFTIVSNELPRLQDSSGAFVGRLVLLKLSKSFYGQEDKGLSDRLMAERASILHWAINGWKRLRDRGRFIQPESGVELVEQLDELSSPINAFVQERCEVGDRYSVEVNYLYRAWCNWCKESGREATNVQTFGRDLRALLPRLSQRRTRVGEHRGRVYEGLRLANELH